MDDIRTRTLDIDTADGAMALFEAIPPGETRGAVIVVQEAFGVNAHIAAVTCRAAAAGYHAVAPHLFHRADGGTVPYGDFSKVMPKFEGLSDHSFLMDVDAALAHLGDAGRESARTGIVGFCMGGRVAFLVALRRALGGAVTFYGGGIVTPRAPQFPALAGDAAQLQTPWLGLFGDRDTSIPVEDVEALGVAVGAARVPAEIVRYADAEHGFHCDVRPTYEPAAAKDAWNRTLDWFAAHVG